MKKGDVFAIDGHVYIAEKNISCVEIEYITENDAALFAEAGFIVKKRPVYSDYLVKVYEGPDLVQAYTVSESDDKISDYANNIWKKHNSLQPSAKVKFSVSYEIIHSNKNRSE